MFCMHAHRWHGSAAQTKTHPIVYVSICALQLPIQTWRELRFTNMWLKRHNRCAYTQYTICIRTFCENRCVLSAFAVFFS